MLDVLAWLFLVFFLFYLLPIGIAFALYRSRATGVGWQTADRSSIGHLPPARDPEAVVRIFSAPTVRWKGIFATHCWIVFKQAGATRYMRYDYTAWGSPIRLNGFEPDGRWFGNAPEIVLAADGAAADALIPRMQEAIRAYAFAKAGDYRAWPGPNSNTFVAAIIDAVPEIRTTLPPTAVGKDYPYDGRWLRRTPSRLGLRITYRGYVGLTVGWVEGLELNLFGAVAGFDIRRPALKLPGLGRLGLRKPVWKMVFPHRLRPAE